MLLLLRLPLLLLLVDSMQPLLKRPWLRLLQGSLHQTVVATMDDIAVRMGVHITRGE